MSILKPELKEASKYIIFNISRMPRNLCFFILYNIIVKYQFGLRIEVVRKSNTEGRKFNISTRKISTGLSNLHTLNPDIGVIPVILDHQLVVLVDNILQE